MSGQRSLCRVYKDRLWDAEGREWTTDLGAPWATAEEVDTLLADSIGVAVVVHGFGRAFRTLNAAEARQFWVFVRHHYQGENGRIPHADGLTYTARIWRRGTEHLLAFVEFC